MVLVGQSTFNINRLLFCFFVYPESLIYVFSLLIFQNMWTACRLICEFVLVFLICFICSVQRWYLSCVHIGCHFQSLVWNRYHKDFWNSWIFILACFWFRYLCFCSTTIICSLTEILEEGRKSKIETIGGIDSSWNCKVWYNGENIFSRLYGV